MKKIFFHILFVSVFVQAQNKEKEAVNNLLDNWYKAAANVSFENYMNAMTDDAIFIGTDATENWTKKDFMVYAKPHFDKGKAWNFTPLERHVYFDATYKTAWFDELLSTQMKICRGSGVLIKTGRNWKIKHYVLSMTIPNDNTQEVIKVKTVIEDKIIDSLKQKKN